ncbi:MAG TPA: lytic transglycosylase domain-containing protein [Elusimicrobiota bacterium]|nr:lytic transglycosylase domain-containing protein [Elusimicrobiota bacterium]
MTISASLKRTFLAVGLGAACSAAAFAQGWRAEPELPESPVAPLGALAQAEIPSWDAARLDHFFDAAAMRPTPELGPGKLNPRHIRLLRHRRSRTGRRRIARRAHAHERSARIARIPRRRLLVPTPKVTPVYRLTFCTLLKHPDETDRYDGLIVRYAVANGLDPRLVKAIIAAESEFDWDARSPVGARGLMQVMPRTGEYFGVPAAELYSPKDNIQAGTAYLAQLLKTVIRFYHLPMKTFRHPPLWLTERVIACYHAGPRYLRHDRWLRQTRLYVRRVLLFYRSAVTQFHWAPASPLGFLQGSI